MTLVENESNKLEEFIDIKSAYDYLEKNALNYKYPHQIAAIFTKVIDKKHEENNSDEEKKAQWEIDVFNFLIKEENIEPRFKLPNDEGKIVEYPNLSRFEEGTYNYLIERLDSTNNPLLKSRYAHILWFSPKKHAKYAQVAIDSYLELVKIYEEKDKKSPLDHHGLDVLDAIKNAYFLARHIKSKKEIIKSEIKRLIFHFSFNSSTSFALRAQLIECMLNEKKIFSKEDFVDIEKICFQVAEALNNAGKIHGAIQMFEIGERVDNKIGKDTQDWRRLIAESYETLIEQSKKSNNPASIVFCQNALENYKKIKDTKKIEELEILYNELKTSIKFSEVKTETDLTEHIKQCEQIAKKLAKEEPETIIHVLMLDKNLLPTYKEMEKAAEEHNKKYIADKLLSRVVNDQNGHAAQHFSTDEEIKYYRILWYYKIFLEMEKMPLIKSIFTEGIKQGNLSTQVLLDFFTMHSWFGKVLPKKVPNNQTIEYNWLNLIAPSLNEYFIQMDYFTSSGNIPNFVMSIDSLTLKIEGLIRDICNFSGVATFTMKKDKLGRDIVREKDIRALLHEEKIKELFDEDDLLFFKFVLIEKAGYNLRHRVAHSLMIFQEYNMNFMLLLILALLKLGKFDFTKKETA